MGKSRNDETDVEREKAYRRGYVFGVQTMMSAIVDKISKAERQKFEAWFVEVVIPWSQGTGKSLPPEAPRW